MRIPLDRESQAPLYRQITDFIRQQIHTGLLAPGTRLPATRDLAAALGVNRITVVTAYDELVAQGLIHSHVGRGTFVAGPLAPLPHRGRPPEAWPLWQQAGARSPDARQLELDRMAARASRPGTIALAGGTGDPTLFDADEFRRVLTDVLRTTGVEALEYGDRAGYRPLRTTIAEVLTSQGIAATPDEVLITSGSQQAIDIVARVLLRPGDAVLVESPTYIGALDIFRLLGAQVVGIPTDEEGMRVDLVAEAVQCCRPKLVYTIPTFHNPTGVSLSDQRRRELVALAHRHGVPILEDDFVGDLRYDGPSHPALKALDGHGDVLYTSTFSKMLSPGLRVGFLVASGPIYERLLACKRTTDLATSSLIQRALQAYISVGRYQAHLHKVCRVYRQRRDAMVQAMQEHLPAGVRWSVPHGGLFVWASLPGAMSTSELYGVAVERGVTFLPGGFAYPELSERPTMRLNFAMQPPEAIDEGIARLGQACSSLMAGAGLPAAPAASAPVIV